jgi:hypothetical protein
MSLEQLERGVLLLSRDERRRFFEWISEHEGELLSEEGDSPEFQAEALRRIADAEKNPSELVAWSESMATIKQRFHEVQGPKPSDR